ncbi:hypothetical protein [Actinokineospora globicatena]|uniref:hypothetical protein n=1 Tax=Actinokineospora globicatena TaxID=103729 RepID=UPI0020A429A9|nr:hypothetical protein [Actinokineospora globicatena]GLW77688.1 hypothetical protein Aglo01_21700 [Actinokineospora globicatena]GLW85643.1 hypothetical protein Aglo02_32830 [Actinokineospora globicatena]
MPPDPPDRTGAPCPHHCGPDGVIRWHQPRPDGRGGTELAQMELPCPAGHAGTWRHPAAERDLVVESPIPTRLPGATDAANQLPPGLAALLTDIHRRAGTTE